LFETFDKRFGADGWAVVMTSDHGATPLVERSPYADAHRIQTGEIVLAVNAAVSAELGDGAWVAKVSSNQLYLTNALTDPAERDRALVAATRTILAMPGIAAVFRVSDTIGHCETRSQLERTVCLALAPRISGDLYVVAKRGSLVTDYSAGTHHDAPSPDNREVPIIVRAAGLAPQRIDHASFLRVAPTVAALLGVPAPSAASESPLFGLPAR